MAEHLRIYSALVAVYRPYVLHRLEGRDVEVTPEIVASLGDGERWLRDALDDLAGTPFALQRRGPLEVFQEAMRFPTAALEEAGHEPVPRDEVTRNALPGDVFDLAPASTRDLGEEVWAAHLEWGAAKAAAFR